MGEADACGVNNGSLYCWGYNSQGEDGIGTTVETKSPAAVSLVPYASGEGATDELGQYTSASSTATDL